MNTVSWMLWLSDALPRLGMLGGVGGTISAIASAILTACGVFMGADYGKDWEAQRKRCVAAAWRTWPIAIVCFIMAIVMPDKTTVLAIAASEVGQMTINTPEAKEIKNEALRALRDWLGSHQAQERKK